MAVQMQAWVYRGDESFHGVTQSSAKNLLSLLENDSDIELAKFVDATFLKSILLDVNFECEPWVPKTILVFPGGTPSIWDDQLGEVTSKIHDFVHAGGRVLGVCAGAYFSATHSSYRVNESYSIDKSRPLKLFDGTALGPKHSPTLEPKNNIQLGKTIKVFPSSESEYIHLYFLSGGYFVPSNSAEEGTDYKVIAKYSDQSLAIVSTRVGDGVALLSFPHFEYSEFPNTEAFGYDSYLLSYHSQLNQRLTSSSSQRKQLIKTILSTLKPE